MSKRNLTKEIREKHRQDYLKKRDNRSQRRTDFIKKKWQEEDLVRSG